MQTQQEPPVLVSVEEAARRLGIGRTATYALVRQHELQSVKIGRTRRVVVASLTDYVDRLLADSQSNQTGEEASHGNGHGARGSERLRAPGAGAVPR